jgi:hypothetical protein
VSLFLALLDFISHLLIHVLHFFTQATVPKECPSVLQVELHWDGLSC